jgi:ribosomal protein S18 acetylase RimI-like enzyme
MAKEDKSALMEILGHTPEFKPSEVSVAEEVIDSYLHNPDSYNIFIASTGADIVGFICYGLTPLTEATWDIYWLVVSPDRQGQGVGSTLMTSAEEKIKKCGGRLVIIETSAKPGYKKTQDFYLKHGCEIVCRIADFYAPNDDKIILQKRLK